MRGRLERERRYEKSHLGEEGEDRRRREVIVLMVMRVVVMVVETPRGDAKKRRMRMKRE